MKTSRGFIFISQLDSSPLLQTLLEELAKDYDINVLFFGKKKPLLFKHLSKPNVQSNLIIRQSPVYFILDFFRFLIFRRRYRPDFLLCSGTHATYLGFLVLFPFRNLPKFFIRHHADIHHQPGSRRIYRFLDRKAVQIANRVIVVSKLVMDLMVKTEGADVQKIVIIPNGINIKDYRLPSKKVSFNRSHVVVGAVSRVDVGKGLQFILRALSSLTSSKGIKFNLKLAGTLTTNLESTFLSSDLADFKMYNELEVFDWINDMPSFYKDLDLLIHVPIRQDFESFGMVYLEGLASGVPCIFTKSGFLLDHPELDVLYKSVPYANSDSISIAVLEYLNTVSLNNRPTSLNLDVFSIENTAKKYRELIRKELTV